LTGALWKHEDLPSIDKYAEYWQSGWQSIEYYVGVDIRPGLYRLTATGTHASKNLSWVPSVHSRMPGGGWAPEHISNEQFRGRQIEFKLEAEMYLRFIDSTLTRISD